MSPSPPPPPAPVRRKSKSFGKRKTKSSASESLNRSISESDGSSKTKLVAMLSPMQTSSDDEPQVFFRILLFQILLLTVFSSMFSFLRTLRVFSSSPSGFFRLVFEPELTSFFIGAWRPSGLKNSMLPIQLSKDLSTTRKPRSSECSKWIYLDRIRQRVNKKPLSPIQALVCLGGSSVSLSFTTQCLSSEPFLGWSL